MLRKVQLYKQRETSFKLAQNVNDVLLPSYNALQDPFLAGYFDNPLIKRNLKETGVIKRKRRYSVKAKNMSPEAKSNMDLLRYRSEKKVKSLVKSTNYFQNQVKLPAL